MVFVYRGVGWRFFVYFLSAVKVFAYNFSISRTNLTIVYTHTQKTRTEVVYTQKQTQWQVVYTREDQGAYTQLAVRVKGCPVCVYTSLEVVYTQSRFEVVYTHETAYTRLRVRIHTNHVRVHTEDCAYTHKAIYVYTRRSRCVYATSSSCKRLPSVCIHQFGSGVYTISV